MLKYLFLLACLLGSAMAAEIDIQTELYIVAGILGGACLLLTIAAIYNSVAIIGLQSNVAVLQAAGTATVKAVAEVVENVPPPRRENTEPAHHNPYESDNRPREPHDSRPGRDDPYRWQDPRSGYKMDRLNSNYDDHHGNNRYYGRQPPKQDDRRPPAGYY